LQTTQCLTQRNAIPTPKKHRKTITLTSVIIYTAQQSTASIQENSAIRVEGNKYSVCIQLIHCKTALNASINTNTWSYQW